MTSDVPRERVAFGKQTALAEFMEVDNGSTCTVRVSGEVDMADADALAECLLGCLGRADVVLADLGGVTFIDSSGLGALLRWRAEATALGKDIALTNVTPPTERLLQITGVRTLFDVQHPGH